MRIDISVYMGIYIRVYMGIFARALLMVFALAAGAPVLAMVTFVDVAKEMGINSEGPTAGSAWGDANGDGWADLWVSNHHGRAPHLFMSQVDSQGQLSGFADAVASLDIYDRYKGDVWPDFHGAAWADYDNDGDQDLIALTGAGAGRGSSANYLFENTEGTLRNRAERFGIDYPQGRGRTPLWFDANADGRLDLLVMNKHRDSAPTRLFQQSSSSTGFVKTQQFEASPGWWAELSAWTSELLGLAAPPISAATEFAQLLPLNTKTASNDLMLLTWGKQTELRTLAGGTFERTKLPANDGVRAIQDAALADFNGDGNVDWLLLRALPFARDIKEVSESELQAVLNGDPDKPSGLTIIADTDITLSAHRPWMDPSDPRSKEPLKLRVGGNNQTSDNITQRFTRVEAGAEKVAKPVNGANNVLSIDWIKSSNTWHLTNTAGPLNIQITTDAPYRSWKAEGFRPTKGAAASALLIASQNIDSDTGLPAEFAARALPEYPCQSVAVADFDNDTDLDAYLVCTNPVDDAADVLLENDGNGNFTSHPQPPLAKGRGNQVSAADFDRDGWIDLAVTNGNGAPPFADEGPIQLLRNTGPSSKGSSNNRSNSWLEIDLQGSRSNRDGIGAVVTLTSGGKEQRRLQDGGSHSFSQNHQRLHFGLGAAEQIDQLEVRWPSGTVQILKNLPARQILLVQEADAP